MDGLRRGVLGLLFALAGWHTAAPAQDCNSLAEQMVYAMAPDHVLASATTGERVSLLVAWAALSPDRLIAVAQHPQLGALFTAPKVALCGQVLGVMAQRFYPAPQDQRDMEESLARHGWDPGQAQEMMQGNIEVAELAGMASDMVQVAAALHRGTPMSADLAQSWAQARGAAQLLRSQLCAMAESVPFGLGASVVTDPLRQSFTMTMQQVGTLTMFCQ